MEIKVWFNSLITYPNIIIFIFYGLSSWLSDSAFSYKLNDKVKLKILTALRAQMLLGWEVLLYVFLTNKVVEAQQMYNTELGSQKLISLGGSTLLIIFESSSHNTGYKEMKYYMRQKLNIISVTQKL